MGGAQDRVMHFIGRGRRERGERERGERRN